VANARDTAAELRAKRIAQRLDAAVRDADLGRLGLPAQATAAIAGPHASREELALLADHVLGLADRAGLLDALRALLVNDALTRGDVPLLRALGAHRAEGGRGHAGGWVLPGTTPVLADPEGTGRAVARRLIATVVADQEIETDALDGDADAGEDHA
jgi:hypothetical protein